MAPLRNSSAGLCAPVCALAVGRRRLRVATPTAPPPLGYRSVKGNLCPT